MAAKKKMPPQAGTRHSRPRGQTGSPDAALQSTHRHDHVLYLRFVVSCRQPRLSGPPRRTRTIRWPGDRRKSLQTLDDLRGVLGLTLMHAEECIHNDVESGVAGAG